MKAAFLPWVMLCLTLLLLPAGAQDTRPASGKTSLQLVGGDTVTGTVSGIRDGEVSLITDYGSIRIPVDKLTPETKTKLGISDKVSVEALQARLRELEALVARLREENAALRQAQSAAAPSAVAPAGRASTGFTPSPSAGEGLKYRMSSTGKRHNSRCRYYNSGGRECGPGDGVACKICGG